MNFSTLAYIIALIFIFTFVAKTISCTSIPKRLHKWHYPSICIILFGHSIFYPTLSVILLLSSSSKKESITRRTNKERSSTNVMTARKVQSCYYTMNDLESPSLRHANWGAEIGYIYTKLVQPEISTIHFHPCIQRNHGKTIFHYLRIIFPP